jgi:hypothetical protein
VLLKILGKASGKIASGLLRLLVGLATGMGATRLLVSIGGALMIASSVFLLEAPLLFRIPFFVGAFIVAFAGLGRLLRWLSIW